MTENLIMFGLKFLILPISSLICMPSYVSFTVSSFLVVLYYFESLFIHPFDCLQVLDLLLFSSIFQLKILLAGSIR
jgi:hypothetical protein